MAPRAEPRGPVARLTLAAAVLLVLLAVVAVASRGRPGHGGSSPRADHVLLDRLFTAFLVLLALYLPIAVWIYWNQRGVIGSELAKRRRSPMRSLLVLGAFLVAAALLVRLRSHLGNVQRLPGLQTVPSAPRAPGLPRTAPDRYEPELDWQAAAIVGGLALVALAILVAALRRSRPVPDTAESDVAQQLWLALAESLDDVLAEPDPRRAVIAAYARMEHALGAAGVPRVPHEVPFEYVGRALLSLDVSESAVRRLTALFERARFSTHTIDETMRADAIAALTRVRDELQREAAA